MIHPRRRKLVETAIVFDGVGTHARVADYELVMVRPYDENRRGRDYFLSGPSTCGLFALGVYRLAGLRGPELDEPYAAGGHLRIATVDLENFGRRHRALTETRNRVPKRLFQAGDLLAVDSDGFHTHIVMCVGDAVREGTIWTVSTIEGGQSPTREQIQQGAKFHRSDGKPNYSYVHRFERKFVERDGALYLGNRSLWWVTDAELLPIPLLPEEVGAWSEAQENARAARVSAVRMAVREGAERREDLDTQPEPSGVVIVPGDDEEKKT